MLRGWCKPAWQLCSQFDLGFALILWFLVLSCWCNLLVFTRCVWRHLATFDDFRIHLKIFGIFLDILTPLEIFGDIWRHLETYTDIQRHLETFVDIWRLLETFKYIWRQLETIKDIWIHLDPLVHITFTSSFITKSYQWINLNTLKLPRIVQ